MDFEQRLKRLETIVQKMEAGDLQLEESLKLFEEGVKLSRDCTQQLSEAEAKVKVLVSLDANGQMVTQEFNPEADK
jgi:exodeoxyribonuclease VII small subunit